MGGVKLLGLGGGNFFVVSGGKVLVIYNQLTKAKSVAGVPAWASPHLPLELLKTC